ncbi:uncharacterized protein LOC133194464 [Saccostrea echinata]|uniref:uncharacterized protein LOC133194464 n=1 Tax=Saccostrea echinata TaxID=191078 RepID=UPI002A81F427|nr:uncharacterized protein LOC133194464 [Saccostrea echinata]
MDFPCICDSFDIVLKPGNILDLGFLAQYGFARSLIHNICSGKNTVIMVSGALAFMHICPKWSKRKTEKVFYIQHPLKSSHLFENFFSKEYPNYSLECINQKDSPPLDSLVLVVCYASSRLKDEVDTALENISYEGKIMLIIIHSCEPTQRPTKILDSCKDKRVKSFTTLLIWNGVFYPCLRNKEAVKVINSYLKEK